MLSPGASPEVARTRSKAHRDRGRPADQRPGMGAERTGGGMTGPADRLPVPSHAPPAPHTLPSPQCPGRGWPQDSRDLG